MMKKIIIILGIILVIGLGFGLWLNYGQNFKPTENAPSDPLKIKAETTPEFSAITVAPTLHEPLSNAQKRIAKKPFGIYITPESSPVSPERFTGFHTGTDFEVTTEELEQEVAVFTFCTGKIERLERISGYGGVIIQSCTIEDRPVLVLYGHVSLADEFLPKIGDIVPAGARLTRLADPYSQDSGGERKHLHLGIVKGEQVDYRGYVDTQAELEKWLDYKNLPQ